MSPMPANEPKNQKESPAGISAERLIEVAPLGAPGGPSSLTYQAPAELESQAVPGAMVEVPLGRRRVPGLIVGPGQGPAPRGLKSILRVLPGAPLPAELLDLTVWAARYYRIAHGRLLRAVLPASIRSQSRRQVVPRGQPQTAPPVESPPLLPDTAPESPAPDADLPERILARLPPEGLDLSGLRRLFGRGTDAAVRRLARQGRVSIENVAIERRDEIHALVAEPADGRLGRAPRQAAIHHFIHERAPHPVSRAEIELNFPGCGSLLRSLLSKGLVRKSAPETDRARPPVPPSPIELNDEQRAALRTLEAARESFATFLLFGVTASGKTEVYLRTARAVRTDGRSVLLLVPEIGLTSQLIEQASRVFPGEIAVLHSGLSEKERARTWHEISAGKTPVVIGARSAVFAPIPDLGLIVVDEEHDTAYKQEESPRYQARDVAIMRGKLCDIPVILSSATPSLESYQAALSGRYELLELRSRATRATLPPVELIDLRDPEIRFPRDSPPLPGAAARPLDPGQGAPQPLSPPLQDALLAGYEAREQSLLFLNRRGFARVIQCDECGRIEECPHCSVSLTFHRSRNQAACHHCGYACTPRTHCPDCHASLSARSFGTEQVERSLAELLPTARVARLDRDTGGTTGFVETTLEAWRRGELDVLIGTQMVAKGHDAPGVTLIGVILADASLHFPDFRANERTFQLLAQVAGRAGRGARPGRVLVQTRHPEHPSLIAATQHDFRSFAAAELRSREELGYPPFGRLARILLEGEAEAVEAEADVLAERLRSAAKALPDTGLGSVQVLGPAPAPIERLRGRYRVQILLKTREPRQLAQILDRAPPQARSAKIRAIVDVDPVSML